MTGSETLANAVGQYRNAYINSLLNKGDPFLAVHFAELILAGLPPDSEEEIAEGGEMKPKVPETYKQWVDDPDGMKYQKEAHNYCKQVMMYAEKKQAKAVYETLARYRAE